MTEETPQDGPSMTDPVAAHWDAVREDMAATAADYEDRGWATLSLHPGDVTPLVGEGVDRPGLDVLLPDDEFEELLAAVDEASHDAYDVYSTVAEGTAFHLIAMEDPDARSAVLYPIYVRLGTDDVAALRAHAEERGRVATLLRPLGRDRIVTFEHEEPGLLFPEE